MACCHGFYSLSALTVRESSGSLGRCFCLVGASLVTYAFKQLAMPIKDWKSALNQFSIMFEERLPGF
jgi:transposase-like protein